MGAYLHGQLWSERRGFVSDIINYLLCQFICQGVPWEYLRSDPL